MVEKWERRWGVLTFVVVKKNHLCINSNGITFIRAVAFSNKWGLFLDTLDSNTDSLEALVGWCLELALI